MSARVIHMSQVVTQATETTFEELLGECKEEASRREKKAQQDYTLLSRIEDAATDGKLAFALMLLNGYMRTLV